MRYLTTHKTRYMYEGHVSLCVSEARLVPRVTDKQRVLSSRIQVDPEPAVMDQRKDYFGNDVNAFSIVRNHDRFTTTATSVVEVDASFEPKDSMPWEQVRDQVSAYADAETLAAYEFVFESPYVDPSRELGEFARPSFTPGRPYAEAAKELSHRIHEEFTYLPKSTSIDMPLAKVFQGRRGVCQDFAHVMIGALRALRLPARYVSGYLRSGAKYQGAEASHAWVAVYIPGSGWVNFDPTNDVMPSDGHVTLAWGRDYGDVTPVRGIALGGGEHKLEVEVRVVPALAEDVEQAASLESPQ
jgi:transglutaminase-like putative cysteine protease